MQSLLFACPRGRAVANLHIRQTKLFRAFPAETRWGVSGEHLLRAAAAGAVCDRAALPHRTPRGRSTASSWRAAWGSKLCRTRSRNSCATNALTHSGRRRSAVHSHIHNTGAWFGPLSRQSVSRARVMLVLMRPQVSRCAWNCSLVPLPPVLSMRFPACTA